MADSNLLALDVNPPPSLGTTLGTIADIQNVRSTIAQRNVQTATSQMELSARQFSQQLIQEGKTPEEASEAVAGIFPDVYNNTRNSYVNADQNARAQADFHAEWMGRAADAYDAALKQKYPGRDLNANPPPPDVDAWHAAYATIPDYVKNQPGFSVDPNKPDLGQLGAARVAAQAVKDANGAVTVGTASVPAQSIQAPVGAPLNLSASGVGSAAAPAADAVSTAAASNALGSTAAPAAAPAAKAPPVASAAPLSSAPQNALAGGAASPPVALPTPPPPAQQLIAGGGFSTLAAPTQNALGENAPAAPAAGPPALGLDFTQPAAAAAPAAPTPQLTPTPAQTAGVPAATDALRAALQNPSASGTAAPAAAASTPAPAPPSPSFTAAMASSSPFDLPPTTDFAKEGQKAAAADLPSTPGTRVNQILTPNQVASRQTNISANTDTLKSMADQQNNVSDMRSKLVQMDSDIKTSGKTGGWFTPGAGYSERLAVANMAQTALSAVGAALPQDMQTAIAAGVQSGKLATNLGFAQARTLGSREAVMVVNQAMATQPNLALPELAGRRLVASLDLNAQYQNDQAKYIGAYYRANPGAEPGTAEAAFVQSHPSTDYAMRAVLQSAPLPGQNPGPGAITLDPPAAVDTLLKNPQAVSSFDKYYGANVGEWILSHPEMAKAAVKAQY